jgi:hypothetical protein
MQQMAKQQSCGPGANNADLRPDGCHLGQKPLLQVKFAASSVLPLPLYFASCGY